MIYEFAAVLQN